MAAAALGTAPLGSTPFGLGTTASAQVPPSRRILAPYIDPMTGQCAVGTDGELEPMPINRQRVLLTVKTRLGSCVILNFGVKLPDKISRSYQDDIRIVVENALDYMVRDGSIALDRIDVEQTGIGRVQITVNYTDRQTGGEDRAVFYG